MESIVRHHIEVRGTVQGVGFRPFVYRLASAHGLAGWVRNRSGGVEIEVEGTRPALASFLRALQSERLPLAHLEQVEVSSMPPVGSMGFEIHASEITPGQSLPVPPDTAPCNDCLRELRDPADRRYRYPFINCTNCGPRFTIIEALPYDRSTTTMRGFSLCADCSREYADPLDRRFHAEPIACPVCGPRLWLEVDGQEVAGDPISLAVELLRAGQILAIKGLGGFHLACDAGNEVAVSLLRARKRRGVKPFAVMCPDLDMVRQLCTVGEVNENLLQSPRRPIVLLSTRANAETVRLAPSVAPGLAEVGVLLPSTPLHELLLQNFGEPLVMTSGNLSEEPIAAENDEARMRLAALADAFLLHNRPIASRYDDSVVRSFGGAEVVLRRARSYAPQPLELPFAAPRPILACGAHLKQTFCLLQDRHAFLSQHLGDLENLETLEHFRTTLALYERLFEVHPEVVAHDLHPEYLSTKLARQLPGVELVGVQHHHAHVVSCMAEHGLPGPVLGVAYDGLGYGTDGHLWGGEVMVVDWRGFTRRAHFREAPLPGGAAAIRKPYRMALGYLFAWLRGELEGFAPFIETIDATECTLIRTQLERGVNSSPTSSCGRLFDALSALLGICPVAFYEGQAAMELQALADPTAEGQYEYGLTRSDGLWIADPSPILRAAFEDLQRPVPVPTISMRFHRTVAELTADLCGRLAEETGLRQVALSGGVFQNHLLLGEVVTRLRACGLEPYFHRRVPTNDGGISLGQAVIASALGLERSTV